MSRVFQNLVLAVCVVLVGAASAQADGWCYPAYSTAYYYPVSYPAFYYAMARPSYYYVQPVVPIYSAAVIGPAPLAVTYFPSVAMPAVTPCPQPLAVAPKVIYARPSAAPASPTKVPAPVPVSPSKEPAPVMQSTEPVPDKKQDKLPTVAESKAYSLGDGKEPAMTPNANGKNTCRVGFWNVTGRDVTITVNGKVYPVARDHNLTLTLGRTFSWQLDARDALAEMVPDDQSSHEIVIRK